MERDRLNEPAHPDRRGGLVFFGILSIVIGALCLLPALALLMAGAMPSGGDTPPPGQLLPGVLMFLCLATLFIWLGVGSILCRRWARALLLVLSMTWSFFGLFFVVAMAAVFTRPDAFADFLPAGLALTGPVALGVIVFYTLLFLGPPIAFFCFYRLPSVKATCESRNPRPTWTDRSPLPVLTMSKLLLLLALSMLLAMPTLSLGAPEAGGGSAWSALFGILMALIFAVLAVEVFRLKRWALIASAVFVLIMQIIVMIMMARSPASVMGAAGDLALDPSMLEEAHGINIAMTMIFSLAWLAYCAWLWRFFPPRRAQAEMET